LKICENGRFLRALLHTVLTPEHNDRIIAACRYQIATADSDIEFFNKTVTGDETWCFAYDPTTKNVSPLQVSEKSHHDRKKKTVISEISCMEHFGNFFFRFAKRNPQRI